MPKQFSQVKTSKVPRLIIISTWINTKLKLTSLWNVSKKYLSKLPKKVTQTSSDDTGRRVEEGVEQRHLCVVEVLKKYCTIGSAWPGFDLRFSPWLLLFKYWTGGLTWALPLCTYWLLGTCISNKNQWVRGSFLLTNSNQWSVLRYI